MPGRCWFLGGAAYRNRTDDLRITRRIRAVHGCPDCHICPARLAAHSTCVRDSPGSLLANPLARSVSQAPLLWLSILAGGGGGGALPGPHARRVRDG
jgi:hypothetical protein